MLHTRLDPLLRLKGWKQGLLMLLSGGAVALSFAPFYAWPLMPIGISTLFLSLYVAQNKRQAFWRGWSWGFGFCLVGMYWICISMLTDLERLWWLIPITLFGLNGALALFWSLASVLFVVLKRPHRLLLNIILFSLSLFAAEMLRSVLFTGLPWNLMGYAWGAHDTSAQIVSVTGIELLTLITLFMAASPALLMSQAPRRLVPFALSVIFMVGALAFGANRLASSDLQMSDVTVRIVQASIPQELKWKPEYQPSELLAHQLLSQAAGSEKIDLFIWPETAYPYVVPEHVTALPGIADFLNEGQHLLTGAVTEIRPNNVQTIFNSIITISGNSSILNIPYRKYHLVPFGEYIPLRKWLPMNKITAGTLDFNSVERQTPIKLGDLPAFVPLICYEAIFPQYAQTTKDAEWILTISNDGWFGSSTGPYQHNEMTRFRAIEQGVPLVRAANNGISSVFDPYGRTMGSLAHNEKAILDVTLPLSLTERTIYSSFRSLFSD